MDSMSITNYDVLVEPSIQGRSGDYQLDKHKDHVGNNRLQVFLTLYQQGYNAARQKGDFNDCNKIVDKIVGTVCYQCVPRGRFLVSSMQCTTVQWNHMDEAGAKALLHKVLQPSIPMINSRVEPLKKDDGQKRRRRSSLLRRSASESMIGMMMDSKKKMNRMDQFREEPTWKSSRPGGQLTLHRMDVILAHSRDALDPNSQSVGNNRLHILLAMQSSKYKDACLDQQEAILDEVTQTVNTFWRGRFLVDGPDGHEELSKEEARNALRGILALRTGQNLRAKRHSAPIQMEIPLEVPAPRGTGRYKRHSAPEPMPWPPLAKQASMSMIPSGPAIDLPDMSNLRSAAVKSLQKQKQRHNIATRLEQMTRGDGPTKNGKVQQAQFQPFPFGGRMQPSRKRESTVLGKLDASVMEQLVADFDEADCNGTDEPLPPTNSNKFGSQFGGRDQYGRDQFGRPGDF